MAPHEPLAVTRQRRHAAANTDLAETVRLSVRVSVRPGATAGGRRGGQNPDQAVGAAPQRVHGTGTT